MGKVYGYARISRKEQSIERQIRNIKNWDSHAIIVQEAYTGTKVEGRKEFYRLMKAVQTGDTIVFDSVSRMSRNATDGIKLYEELFERNVQLVFLKERYIDTETYRKASSEAIPMTGNEAMDEILSGVNRAMKILRREQIIQAFKQAQKEVEDLHQRTKEGIATARLHGKQIGGVKGKKLHIKKAEPMKESIMRLSRDFNGILPDKEVIKLTGLARNTYYKYKKDLKQQLLSDLQIDNEG